MAHEDRFVAEIIMVPFNFRVPAGYAPCDGRMLLLSQNTALFSLLGTNYGGDGKSTFALPDLEGRVPIGAGQGPGLTERIIGEEGGQAEITLLVSEIPAHTHVLPQQPLSLPAGDANNTHSPVGAYPGVTTGQNLYSTTAGSGTLAPLHASLETGVAGASLPVNNVQPSLTIRYLISLQGIFPPRG
jgi:microcystin-dependent protein